MFEIATTTTETLYWRSEKANTSVTVKHLIEEISFMLHIARQHGCQGMVDAFDDLKRRRAGFNRIPFLIEAGLMKPILRSVGDDEDEIEAFEITSVADVEAALLDLQNLLAANPQKKTKDTRPL